MKFIGNQDTKPIDTSCLLDWWHIKGSCQELLETRKGECWTSGDPGSFMGPYMISQ